MTEQYTCFNPRSREGNDIDINTLGKQIEMFQSTFPRGKRRFTGLRLPVLIRRFNPRSREGNDISSNN